MHNDDHDDKYFTSCSLNQQQDEKTSNLPPSTEVIDRDQEKQQEKGITLPQSILQNEAIGEEQENMDQIIPGLPPTTSFKYLPYKLLLMHNQRPFFKYLLERKGLLIALNLVSNILAGANLGYNLSIVSGVLDPILTEYASVFKGRDNIASGFLLGLVSSCYVAGCIIGCISGGIFSDFIGRKFTTFLAGGLSMVGSVLSSVSPAFWFMNLTRVIVGVGNSMLIVSSPMMTAEVAFIYAPKRAGMIGSSLQFGIALGILLGYVMSFAFMDVRFTWRYMFALCNLVCGPLMIFSLLIPESPTWINLKLAADIMRQEKRVLKNDTRVETAIQEQNPPSQEDSIQSEAVIDANNVENEETFEKQDKPSTSQTSELPNNSFTNTMKNLFCTLRNMRRLLVGFVLVVCMTWLGINAILFYTVDLFKAAGLKTRTGPLLASIGLGGWIVLTTFLSLLSDVLGRRLIIVPGVSLMTISCIVLGFMFKFVTNDTARGITSIAMVCLYFVGFNGLLGGSFVPYLNEMFTTDVRVIAVSILLSLQWILNLVLGLIFLPVKEAIGQAYIFWFFGALGIIAVILLVIFMPETKNELSSKNNKKSTEETKNKDIELVEQQIEGDTMGKKDLEELGKAEGGSESKEAIGVIVLEDFSE